jgi:hypothetical protein
MIDLGHLTTELTDSTMSGWADHDPALEQIIASLYVKPSESLNHEWLRTGERVDPFASRRDPN